MTLFFYTSKSAIALLGEPILFTGIVFFTGLHFIFNAEAIVFENLKGWKPTGGRKRSTLRQRFHGWLKAMIRDYTEMKWQEVGGKKAVERKTRFIRLLLYRGNSGVI